MFAGVKKFAMDILTEDDANSVFCPVRIIGVSGAATLIAMAGYHLIVNKTLDPVSYGTGVATIAGATGLGVGAKAKMGG